MLVLGKGMGIPISLKINIRAFTQATTNLVKCLTNSKVSLPSIKVSRVNSICYSKISEEVRKFLPIKEVCRFKTEEGHLIFPVNQEDFQICHKAQPLRIPTPSSPLEWEDNQTFALPRLTNQ
jgi:hypothetical protein